MSTARDHFQEDMHKRPDQLAREADDVRADFEHTVEELMNQFSPGELFNQALSKFRGSGDSAFVQNLSAQIQNNPIPAILAGASLTWLMSASKQPPARPDQSSGGGLSSARDRFSSATDQVRSSTQMAKEGARERGHQAAAGASELKEKVSHTGQQAMESARSGARSARENYQYLLSEQPLLVGALAVAAGAALGAMFPRTQAEDRAMGEISDQQTGAMRQKAEGMAEKATAKAEEKLDEQRPGDGQSGPAYPAGQRDEAVPTVSHAQMQNETPSSASPPAGASGPPGHAGVNSRGGERGTPRREPTSAPGHPGTNPPANNRDGSGQ
ncbi:MAG: hypothetical protein ACOCVV_08680 [Marinobacter sp.]